jgi:hydroxyacylglutathione hydrolase
MPIMTAALAWLVVSGAAATCFDGDLDRNGVVDGADLGIMLTEWDQPNSIADLNGDGTVDGADLGALLASWGGEEIQAGSWPSAGGGPEGWISGAPNCATEPKMQVHWYNDDYAVIRQSLCTNFEGPFMHLLFGQDKVLMQDTGAGGIQIYNKVQEVIGEWLARNGKTSIQLIVSHTHGHGDHVAGDSQFNGKPNTTVVGISQTSVKNFFGIVNWPTQIVEYDLGGRIIDIIPIPGHQTAHIAYYDRQTGILFTGDTLYPGRLYISNFSQYVDSIERLVDFTVDKPVCWVIGTHVEMSTTPTVDFPIGSTSHPNEHELELTRDHLHELYDALLAMNGVPEYEEHDDFIIFPLGATRGAAVQDNGTAVCCDRPRSVFDLKWAMQRGAPAQERPGNVPK